MCTVKRFFKSTVMFYQHDTPHNTSVVVRRRYTPATHVMHAHKHTMQQKITETPHIDNAH